MKFVAGLILLSQMFSTYTQAQNIKLSPHDHFTAKSKDNVTTLTLKEEGAGDLFVFANKISAAGLTSIGSAEGHLIISCKRHQSNMQYDVVTECKFQFTESASPSVQYLVGSPQVIRLIASTQSVLGLELVAPTDFNLFNSYGQRVVIQIHKYQTLISLEYNGYTRN